jgi:hypothetical protein
MAADSNHISDRELKAIAARTGGLNELVRINPHLDSCTDCQQKLIALRPAPKLPSDLPDVDTTLHLSFEQMTAYIDAELSQAEREKIDTHVLICKRCAQELKGLQAFESTFTATAWELAAVGVQATEKRPAWVEWLSRFLSTPQRLQYVGVSLCVTLFGLLTMSRAHVASDSGPVADGSFHVVPSFGSSSHAGLLAGALLIAGGVVGFLYGIFKKS